jgi:hypothetical protein
MKPASFALPSSPAFSAICMESEVGRAIGYGAADPGAMLGETEDDLAPWLAVKKSVGGCTACHIALIGCKFADVRMFLFAWGVSLPVGE